MPIPQLVNAPGGAVLSTTSVNSRTSTDVTITPASTAGWPGAPWFTVLVRETSELLAVTAVNVGPPTTWTVTRGYGGSAAQAIPANAHLDYSLTREMLLGGMVCKLDEQALTVATTTVSLTVPPGLPLLRALNVKARVAPSNGVFNYLQARFGGDASANYNVAYHYGGVGHSNGVWGGLAFWRVGWGSNDLGFFDLQIDGLSEAIFTRYTCHQWYFGGGNERYSMQTTGDHRVATAFNSITFSLDSAGNGVWAAINFAAGTVFSLYGVP
jgi:hypothetical protein